MELHLRVWMRFIAVLLALLGTAWAQSGQPGVALSVAAAAAPPSPAAPAQAAPAQSPAPAGSRFAIEIAPSTLGISGLLAVRLSQSLNLRVGYSGFGISHAFDNNGLDFTGHLDFRSAQATADWYFWKAFHLSPGVLFYNGNSASATLTQSGGQQFTLNGDSYTSSTSNPLTGTGTLTLGKAGPMLLIGVGNPVPRGGGHFRVTLDAGAAYVQSPNVAMNLAGSVCNSSGANCAPVSSYPGFESDLAAQVAKYNRDLRPFRFYPVVSLGFSYSFGKVQ